jgi:hypothetical protein
MDQHGLYPDLNGVLFFAHFPFLFASLTNQREFPGCIAQWGFARPSPKLRILELLGQPTTELSPSRTTSKVSRCLLQVLNCQCEDASNAFYKQPLLAMSAQQRVQSVILSLRHHCDSDYGVSDSVYSFFDVSGFTTGCQ